MKYSKLCEVNLWSCLYAILSFCCSGGIPWRAWRAAGRSVAKAVRLTAQRGRPEVHLRLHFKEIWICVFPEKELRGLSPSFHSHVSVSDLYIPTFGPPILLQQNRQTNQKNIYINRSEKHECRNWDCGRAVPFLGILVSNFRYSIFAGYEPDIQRVL